MGTCSKAERDMCDSRPVQNPIPLSADSCSRLSQCLNPTHIHADWFKNCFESFNHTWITYLDRKREGGNASSLRIKPTLYGGGVMLGRQAGSCVGKYNDESPKQGSKSFNSFTKTIHFAHLSILFIYGFDLNESTLSAKTRPFSFADRRSSWHSMLSPTLS